MSRYRLGTYLAGATVARTADEMSGPALLLLGLAVTGSARTAALLYAALTIAGGCGGPLFGVLLDRSAAPGRVLAWALAGYAAGLGAVAVSLGHLPLVAVAVLAAAAGFLAPSLTGGWTSRLPGILPAPRLARGYALDVSTYSAAALIGPALAGLVAAAAGAGWAVAVVVALLLLGAPAAWLLPRPEPAGRQAARGSVLSDLRAGFGAIAGVPSLLRITACLGDRLRRGRHARRRLPAARPAPPRRRRPRRPAAVPARRRLPGGQRRAVPLAAPPVSGHPVRRWPPGWPAWPTSAWPSRPRPAG